jgi:hypothetical protein
MALEAVLRAVAPRSKEIIFQGFQRLRLQPGKMTGILHFINQDLNNFVQGPGPVKIRGEIVTNVNESGTRCGQAGLVRELGLKPKT